MTEIVITNSSSAGHTYRDEQTGVFLFQGMENFNRSIPNVAYGAVVVADGAFAVGAGYSNDGIPKLREAMSCLVLGQYQLPKSVGDTLFTFGIYTDGGVFLYQRSLASKLCPVIYTIIAQEGSFVVRPATISYNRERGDSERQHLPGTLGIVMGMGLPLKHYSFTGKFEIDKILTGLGVSQYGYAYLPNPEVDFSNLNSNRRIMPSAEVPAPQLAPEPGHAPSPERAPRPTREPRAPRPRRGGRRFGLVPRLGAAAVAAAVAVTIWHGEIKGFLDGVSPWDIPFLTTPSVTCVITTDGGVGAGFRVENPETGSYDIIEGVGFQDGTELHVRIPEDKPARLRAWEALTKHRSEGWSWEALKNIFGAYINPATCIPKTPDQE